MEEDQARRALVGKGRAEEAVMERAERMPKEGVEEAVLATKHQLEVGLKAASYTPRLMLER